MSLGNALASGLGEYLHSQGTKNLAGISVATAPPRGDCTRRVMDIRHSSALPFPFDGDYRVRIHCGLGVSSATQLVPEGRFSTLRELVTALDTDYAPWGNDLEFRVESPPRRAFGIYDHYRFTTGHDGKVTGVTDIIRATNNTP